MYLFTYDIITCFYSTYATMNVLHILIRMYTTYTVSFSDLYIITLNGTATGIM
jgi:hypothetical protein